MIFCEFLEVVEFQLGRIGDRDRTVIVSFDEWSAGRNDAVEDTDPTSTDTVAFGNRVTFRRDDGRVQKYRIVGEDEADPKLGSISFVSPVARLLMGKAVGDVASTSKQEFEIISIS